VEDHGRELLSDNWFDLLPGVPVRVYVTDPQAHVPVACRAADHAE